MGAVKMYLLNTVLLNHGQFKFNKKDLFYDKINGKEFNLTPVKNL
jgi:hypothetical protein